MNAPYAENFVTQIRRLPWISILVWLLALAPLLQIALHPENFQWDFRLFYSAGLAADAGVNPYDNALRNAVYPAPSMEFFYPPITLYLFELLKYLPYESASLLWIALKLSAFALLLMLWHKKFEPLNAGYPIVLFFVFAYSGTLYLDIAAGNIAIFEQLIIWLGFYFFIERKYLLFGLCIALASQFKLQPIVLLGLLLIVEERPRWLALGASIAAFLGLLFLNYLLQPDLTWAFISRLTTGGGNLREIGVINPSLLALIQDVVNAVSTRIYQLPVGTARVLYVVLLGQIAAVFLYFFILFRRKNPNYDLKILVYISCFLYAVTAARMKDYSYVICLLPTLVMIRSQMARKQLIPLIALLVCAPADTSYVPFLSRISNYFYDYLPLLVAATMLVVFLYELRKHDGVDSMLAPGVRQPEARV